MWEGDVGREGREAWFLRWAQEALSNGVDTELDLQRLQAWTGDNFLPLLPSPYPRRPTLCTLASRRSRRAAWLLTLHARVTMYATLAPLPSHPLLPLHPLLTTPSQANTLHSQIQEIQERRAAADRARQGDKSFLQLKQAQTMATMVARKKEDLNAKLERLQVGGAGVWRGGKCGGQMRGCRCEGDGGTQGGPQGQAGEAAGV